MNGLVTVDVVSRVWAAEQQAMAEVGRRHGEDYVFTTCVPSLGEWVYSVTPGARLDNVTAETTRLTQLSLQQFLRE